ncbi:hypothetical protein [Streptomyces griseosporeus]|uniref:hypothetical protein n=1 Tax=Streptomyces griseosporeus TaxID=1910 RepID=UPI00167DADA0|nr:hypothetical protein [Streptomyces griseosporeus]GHF36169.1 hypothetical protein GCM10018783_00550 [Streptomyces griseosporeus]
MEIPEELITELQVPALELSDLQGVNGVGLGMREENEEFFEELAVRVYVDDATDVPELPTQLADLPVCVVEFPIEPLFTPDSGPHDTLMGGVQIQQAPQASGTLGAVVMRNDDNTLVGLTCHHVSGDIESRVFQPEAPPMPIGSTPDLSASLGKVIDFDSPVKQTIPTPAGRTLWLGRQVDAAIFDLDEAVTQDGDVREFSNEIADGFGAVAQTLAPTVGMFVRKRGSQSGPTGGLIVGVALAVPWHWGSPPSGHQFAMANQFDIFYLPSECPDGIIARGGDSGSVVLQSGTNNAVGLLWGGNNEGGRRALMSDITMVEQRLNVTLVWDPA